LAGASRLCVVVVFTLDVDQFYPSGTEAGPYRATAVGLAVPEGSRRSQFLSGLRQMGAVSSEIPRRLGMTFLAFAPRFQSELSLRT